jgi:hypothetical protein
MRMLKIISIALFPLFIVGPFTLGASFQEIPPTIGAYTLQNGEWQVGLNLGLPLQSPNYWTMSGSIAYGITDRLQASIGIGYGLLPGPSPSYTSYSLSGKLRWSFPKNFDLAFPISISFLDTGAGTSFSGIYSGVVFSMKTGLGFTLHGGWGLSYSKTGFYWGSPYGMADIDILPTLKVVAEFSLRPISLSVDLWLRTLDFLDIAFTFRPLPLWLGLATYVRF